MGFMVGRVLLNPVSEVALVAAWNAAVVSTRENL